MISNVLREGMKIDIRIVNQTERTDAKEKETPVYKSQIYELFENGEMEIMMPIQSGKIILLPLGLRYEFVFYTPNGLYKSIGQIRERYKTENRYLLRIVLNTPLSKYQRREKQKKGTIVDISGGGVRFVTNEQLEEGKAVLIIVMLQTQAGEKQYYLPGHILRSVKLLNRDNMYENRLKFIIHDDKIREEIIKYIFAEERKARQRGKG